MIRGDLSSRLIHLTKGKSPEEAAANFESIVRTGTLWGGNGYIRGGYNCVCFSEAPISIFSQLLAHPPTHSVRYAPFGVMVGKQWLFERGGRPVIYQADEEYDLLPEALRFRHVRYEPHNEIDHTWEREWRIKTNELPLDTRETTLVIPTREWEERFLQEYLDAESSSLAMTASEIREAWGSSIEIFPWHFIALEDLGIDITWP